MDALERAKELVQDAYYDERGMADVMRKDAAVWAAIAQAEAMQLIAKRLEQWMESQGVGFEMIEAAERGLHYQKENERLRNQHEMELAVMEERIMELEAQAEPNEALEDFKYRKAQAEAWAKAERGE